MYQISFVKLLPLAFLSLVSSQQYYAGYQQMLTLVNQARQQAGLQPVCNAAGLMSAASQHSTYMASNNNMTHDDPNNGPGPTGLLTRFDNNGFQCGSGAECVAMEGSQDPSVPMQGWMADPAHKALILGPYTHIGSAYGQGSDGNYYWTLELASPMSGNGSSECLNGGDNNNNNTTTTPSSVTSTTSAPAPTLISPDPSTNANKKTTGPLIATRNPHNVISPAPKNNNGNNGAEYICLRNLCYRIIRNVYGDGFIPSNFKPANTDISNGPVMVEQQQ